MVGWFQQFKGSALQPHEQKYSSLQLYSDVTELSHVRVVAAVCFVLKVISDGLFIRGREGCDSS